MRACNSVVPLFNRATDERSIPVLIWYFRLSMYDENFLTSTFTSLFIVHGVVVDGASGLREGSDNI